MIFNGPKLLISPKRFWPANTGHKSGIWLIAAAVTAAVLPAAGMVVGHLGSAILGYTDHATAILRAAVGFIAIAGGALVMAPALTLLLLWIAGISRAEASESGAKTMAMAMIWPVWTAGLILAVPPLLGAGPEVGEALWAFLAIGVALRTIRSGDVSFIGVRRRWRGYFTVRAMISFVLLFVVVVVGPSVMVRGMLGAAGQIVPTSLPDRVPLPVPDAPNW